MKIREDFVTNSSSSCFVVITVEMLDGSKLSTGFDSGDQSMDPDFVPFSLDDLKAEGAEQSGRELVRQAAEWMRWQLENDVYAADPERYFMMWARDEETARQIRELESFDNVHSIRVYSEAYYNWWEDEEQPSGEDEYVIHP